MVQKKLYSAPCIGLLFKKMFYLWIFKACLLVSVFTELFIQYSLLFSKQKTGVFGIGFNKVHLRVTG